MVKRLAEVPLAAEAGTIWLVDPARGFNSC